MGPETGQAKALSIESPTDLEVGQAKVLSIESLMGPEAEQAKGLPIESLMDPETDFHYLDFRQQWECCRRYHL